MSAVALVPGKAEAKVGAATRTAGRKKLKRNSKPSAKSRKTAKKKAQGSEDLALKILQQRHASKPKNRNAKRREELSEDPAQEQAADQRMLLHELTSRRASKPKNRNAKRREELSEDPAQGKAAGQRMLLHELTSRHAKKIVKKRELVGAGRVRVKEDGQMKAIYTAGRRSTRAVLLRWSRRTT